MWIHHLICLFSNKTLLKQRLTSFDYRIILLHLYVSSTLQAGCTVLDLVSTSSLVTFKFYTVSLEQEAGCMLVATRKVVVMKLINYMNDRTQCVCLIDYFVLYYAFFSVGMCCCSYCSRNS